MPLRDDLLNPIAGDNPSGANLRYAPVFDKIKEARREEDVGPLGDYRDRKTADHNQVIKLGSEVLATQSKDLQIAVWLAEAMLRKEGFAGFQQSLEMIKGLVENFWDTLYPEIEDDDLELRAAPLEWAGTRLVDAVNNTPVTKGGVGFYRYKDSRGVPTEIDCADNEAKRESRERAVRDGKLTPEDWEKDYLSTPTSFYETRMAALEGCVAAIEELNTICSDKFGNVAPTFSPLHAALEEVRHLVRGLLQRRHEAEGKVAVPEDETVIEETVEEVSGDGAATAAVRKKRGTLTLEPEDLDDAAARLSAVAKFLRQQDAYSPAPYLLLRGYRWGEVRGYGESPDPMNLLPPTSEVRQAVRRLSLESNWVELLDVAETAMAQPCGRAWLDLQRYVVRACDEAGFYAVSAAIRAELRGLLADLPNLPNWTLMDDTPAANPETQAWLKDFAQAQAAGSTGHTAPAAMIMESDGYQNHPGEPAPPDTYQLALEAARSGRASDAIELIATEIPRERSGRARFQRKLQLAQICMMTGHESLAQPILEEMSGTIETHKLEDWESADIVAHPLTLLYRCITKLHGDADLKQRLYARISRLDPVQALQCLR